MIDPSLEPRLVSLNLVYDYPVYWDRFKVLRDFVQNLYDALQWPEWERRFSYSLVDGTLTLNAADVGFSYEWLLHIGASTKRGDSTGFAGHFGEGFKIASLCALRDHGWHISLRSRDWTLDVTTAELKVDGHSLQSLAYAIAREPACRPDTELRIAPFQDRELLNAVLLSFYYPGNPLFGEPIWESRSCAVYHRSNMPKPAGYPGTTDDWGTGIVFAGYQALGSFRNPLIFCRHDARQTDRDRRHFFRMDVVRLVQQTVRDLPPGPSAEVLKTLRRRWNDQPTTHFDFDTWSGIVRTLVVNIADSPEQAEAWRRAYPGLLVAPRVKRSNISACNRRRQALDWWRSQRGRSGQLVQEAFGRLGYQTLEEACQRAAGFSTPRPPDAFERARIELLEALACRLAPDLFERTGFPICQVIESDTAIWQGMASCVRVSGRLEHFRGIPIRYRQQYVAIKRYVLVSARLGTALSTYLHEVAHVFGGDRSAAFSEALSALMAVLVENADTIGEWRERWEAGSGSLGEPKGSPIEVEGQLRGGQVDYRENTGRRAYASKLTHPGHPRAP